VNVNDTMNSAEFLDHWYDDSSYASTRISSFADTLTNRHLTPQWSTSSPASTSRRQTKLVPSFDLCASQVQYCPTPTIPCSTHALDNQSGLPACDPDFDYSLAIYSGGTSSPGTSPVALDLDAPTFLEPSFPSQGHENIVCLVKLMKRVGELHPPIVTSGHNATQFRECESYQERPVTCASYLVQKIAPSLQPYDIKSTPALSLADTFVPAVQPSFARPTMEKNSSLGGAIQDPSNLRHPNPGSVIFSYNQESLPPVPFGDDGGFPVSFLARKAYAECQTGSSRKEHNRVGRVPRLCFSCHMCTTRFMRQDDYKRHLRVTHGTGEMEVCRVPECGTQIKGRPDNMRAHYRKTHMYGSKKRKGKKNILVTVQQAKQYGIGHLDERTNPRPPRTK